METLSTLLAICESNPVVTGGFHLQRTGNVEFLCFRWCKFEQFVEEAIKLPVI